jgi:hypothetical protein
VIYADTNAGRSLLVYENAASATTGWARALQSRTERTIKIPRCFFSLENLIKEMHVTLLGRKMSRV